MLIFLLGPQDGRGGDGIKLDIGKLHGGALSYALDILEHVYILLWDALGRCIVGEHLVGQKVDEVNGLEVPAIFVEVIDKLTGCDNIAERL